MKFEVGEVVVVSDMLLNPEPDELVYAQKFVIEHNGIFYCERDDGKQTTLVGWRNCRKNIENFEYFSGEDEDEAESK